MENGATLQNEQKEDCSLTFESDPPLFCDEQEEREKGESDLQKLGERLLINQATGQKSTDIL